MKLTSHITVSFSISAVLYLIFRSNLLAVSSFLFGIFIDLDHFFEYFYHGRLKFDIKEFFQLAENYAYKKSFLFLHSWELFLICAVLVFIRTANEILFGCLVGYGVHLLFDQVGNLSKPLSYFFIYRWKLDFLTEKIWRVDLLDCK